ncbi:portal protein [Mesorhizobium yinganensis]|uniref:portal protein n=1 Tax=Mesorhizobium yinganensis TaxID=3157707 RepID=UPI0032B80C9C
MATDEQTLAERPINPAMAPKLTDWKNEPDVRVLAGDMEAARPAHDTFVMKVRRWAELHSVSGSQKPAKVKGRSSVQPKLIRRQAEWRYPALTEPFNSSEKLFDVTPVTFEDGKAAEQNEIVLNWQFRTKINRVTFIDNYVRACVDEGSAIVRLGWCRTTATEEQEVPVWEYLAPQTQAQIQQLEATVQLKQANPRAYNEDVNPALQAAVDYFEETGQPTVARQNGTQKIPVEKIIDNRPTLRVENPENCWWDPTCGDDLDKAGFFIVSFETSQADLKKEPGRYRNLEFIDWEAATTVAVPDHMPQSVDVNFNFKDLMRKKVVAYEYWGFYDINGDGTLVPIVATWIGNTLIRMEENPFPDGKIPFVIASYMPVKRQVTGEPDAELLEDNQKILGAVSRGMIDLLGRSANAQQGFAKGMLDPLNRRRFESGQDYEFNPQMNPNAGGFIEHKYPEIPQSALAMLTMQNQEAEALTGVKAFSGGMTGEAYGDVAAGIRGILDAAAKREMSILRRLASGLVLIGKKIIAMNGAFLSEEEVVRVTNDTFITVKREDLAGNFDMKVDISTAEIDNAKAQELGFMLQTLGNSIDFKITKIILVKIAKLKRMPELAKELENYEPQPDPMQQQLIQLQIEKEKKEIEKLQSEIDLNKAKALKEQVVAEQSALDTVEQETGTKHAREIEKQRAQATGNQDLEITKAITKPRKAEESKPDIEAAIGYNELSKIRNDPRNGGLPVNQPPIISQTQMI